MRNFHAISFSTVGTCLNWSKFNTTLCLSKIQASTLHAAHAIVHRCVALPLERIRRLFFFRYAKPRALAPSVQQQTVRTEKNFTSRASPRLDHLSFVQLQPRSTSPLQYMAGIASCLLWIHRHCRTVLHLHTPPLPPIRLGTVYSLPALQSGDLWMLLGPLQSCAALDTFGGI